MAEDEKPEVQASDGGGEQKPAEAGSAKPEETKSDPPEQGKSGGESEKTVEETVPKNQYEEAQQLIGKQGKELGDMRKFFEEISPLLDQLQAQPEVIEAIMAGKIDSELAKSVLEGKVGAKEAEEVTKAHDEVKESMTEEKYEAMKPADIEKLVSDKVNERLAAETASLKKDITELEDKQEFIKSAEKFAANAPDFDKHAEDIVEWLDGHPEVYDISVAYEAVVGRKALMQAQKNVEADAAEAAKKVAANAGGGGGSTTANVDEKELVDTLIGDSHNPNRISV